MKCYCVIEHGTPLEAVEVPTPTPTGTQVMVKVRAAGLCHTDLHLWEGYYNLGGGKRLQLSERGVLPPLVLSHEVAGEIVAAGENTNVALGQRVLVHPWIGCGHCVYCQRDQENLCLKPEQIGIKKSGGFGEYVIVPHPRYLVDIESLDYAEAAPLACAGVSTFSALKKFGENINHQPVLIIGAGGLGLMTIKLLTAMGAKPPIVIDIDDKKLVQAKESGAAYTFNSNHTDTVNQIKAITEDGAALILDLVGSADSLDLAIKSACRGSHIVVCGLIGGELNLSIPLIPMRPLKIEGSYVGTVAELQELVNLVKTTKMQAIPVTRRPIQEINAAFDALHQGHVIGRIVLHHEPA